MVGKGYRDVGKRYRNIKITCHDHNAYKPAEQLLLDF